MSIGLVTSQNEVAATVQIAPEMRALFKAHRSARAAATQHGTGDETGDLEAANRPNQSELPPDPAAASMTEPPVHPGAGEADSASDEARGSDTDTGADAGTEEGIDPSDACGNTTEVAQAGLRLPPKDALTRQVLRRDGRRPLVFEGIPLLETRRSAGNGMDDQAIVSGIDGFVHRFGLYLAADGSLVGALAALVLDDDRDAAGDRLPAIAPSHAAREIGSPADIDGLLADAEPTVHSVPRSASAADHAIRTRALLRGELRRLVDNTLSAHAAGEPPSCLEGPKC